ncbi:MAG: PA2779 family protein [Pseudohongiellaceae bacterium]|nr:PA2779 family protein [Pseudohongiellaceae bacterium]
MKMITMLKKSLPSLLIVVFSFCALQAPAMASVVTTEQLMAEQRIEQQREAAHAFFSRQDVQAQLVARGVDVKAAQSRIASMSAAELSTLNQQIDTMPAGEGLGLVIGLLVIFMLLDIAGVTDIFPGI